MKQVLTFVISTLIIFPALAQSGYKINIELKPYRNSQIYLGYYYGNVKALADSAMLDSNSTGIFKGDQNLPGGIYFLVSPSKQILFEVLIDKDQNFQMSADSSRLPESLQFKGSSQNQGFQAYSSFAAVEGKKITALNEKLTKAKTAKDSASVSRQLRTATSRLQLYRDSITKKTPESFLATLFNAMNEPKVPPVSQHPGGKYDSNFVYRYFKLHYWDNIAFDDSRLVRTPFFEPRLDKYFQNLVSPNPDSIIKEIDYMLLYARTSEEMYRYLMVHFVQKYINPQYMGQDAVFVHLFEKYINTGKAEFFTQQYKDFAARRAYSLMANLIGQPAPELNFVDTSGRPDPLGKTGGEFTVICFWDPTCSHCKETVPRVDSIFNAKWKKQNVVMYGVRTDGTMPEWLTFIHEKNLQGWHHVYQPQAEQDKEIKEKRPGYKQLYDVYQTPLLYLLDKDKRIIAKKLTYLQIDEVINAKLKTKSK